MKNKTKVYIMEGGDGFDGFNIYRDLDFNESENQLPYNHKLDVTVQQDTLAKQVLKKYPNAIFCGELEPYNNKFKKLV